MIMHDQAIGFSVLKAGMLSGCTQQSFAGDVTSKGSEIKTKTVMDDPGKCLIIAAEGVKE